jgi:HPr kinase/phosphorylase
MEYRIPCFVFSRDLDPDRLFLKAAERADIPVFKSPLITMRFINQATLALEMMFAPRGTDLGSMVDILGVGVIIRGESGIGKSECVLALIERGYSLVSDDVTRVTLMDGREVVGMSAEATRNYMEVRGIGIVNVASMFGVRSVRAEKKVDLVVTLKTWEKVKDVDRLGLEQQHTKILGIPIPHIVIPVRPGRDLARLVEVAAFQTKLRSAGANAPRDLDEHLIRLMRGA